MTGIAVVRAMSGLGDMLCLVPALRSIRAGAPDAHVALIGLERAQWVVERFPDYVDELIPFPGWPGMDGGDGGVRHLPAFLAAMHEREFDLALQCQGGGLRSNPFVRLLGARHDAGYVLGGQWCPDPERYLAWDGHAPEAARWVQLVTHLGFPDRGVELELPVTDADRGALAAVWQPTGRPYACVHPGATHPARRWSAEGFAGVGDRLAERGLDVVLTGGAEDRPLTSTVAAAMSAPAVDLAGALSLGALAALVDGAALVVTNDTGTSHVAAAVRTPSVVVFRASDPSRWAPTDHDRHRVVGTDEPIVAEHLARRGVGRCLAEGCAKLAHDVAVVPPPRVTADDVMRVADDLLASAP